MNLFENTYSNKEETKEADEGVGWSVKLGCVFLASQYYQGLQRLSFIFRKQLTPISLSKKSVQQISEISISDRPMYIIVNNVLINFTVTECYSS
jgi:hypothetical protein